MRLAKRDLLFEKWGFDDKVGSYLYSINGNRLLLSFLRSLYENRMTRYPGFFGKCAYLKKAYHSFFKGLE